MWQDTFKEVTDQWWTLIYKEKPLSYRHGSKEGTTLHIQKYQHQIEYDTLAVLIIRENVSGLLDRNQSCSTHGNEEKNFSVPLPGMEPWFLTT